MKTILAWYRSSIAHRMMSMTLAVGVIAITFILSLSLFITYGVIKTQVNEDIYRDLILEKIVIEKQFQDLGDELRSLATNTVLVNGLSDLSQRQAYIGPWVRGHRYVREKAYGLAVLNYRGQVIIQSAGLETLSDGVAEQIKSMLASGKTSHIFSGNENLDSQMLALEPILNIDATEVQGYVLLLATLSQIWSEQLGVGRDLRTWDIKLSQESLMNPTIDSISQTQVRLDLPPPWSGLNLELHVANREAIIYQAFRGLWPQFLGLAVVTLTLLILMSRYISDRLTKPIREATQFTQSVRLSGITPQRWRYQGTDELALLSTDMGAMLDELDLLQRGLQGQIHERNQRLNAIFDLSPDGFFEFSQEGVITFVNPTVCNMLGVSEDQITGLTWTELAPLFILRQPKIDPHVFAEIPTDLRMELYQPDKRIYALQSRKTHEGRVILYCKDVSRDAELLRLKNEFLATAAHELRTPLMSIMGFSQILKKRQMQKPDEDKAIEVILRQTQALIQLVNDLLDLARIDAKVSPAVPLEKNSISIATRMILEEFNVPNDPRQLHLFLDDHLPEVSITIPDIRKIVLNLISNAFKYSPTGSPIEVRCYEEYLNKRRYIILSIQDFGSGLTEQEIEHLGERFFRTQGSQKIQGTGLGLSLVKEVVENMGGYLEFHSKPQQGTQVKVLFPVAV